MNLSPSQKETVRHQFDSFCRKVLRNAYRDYLRQISRRAAKEVSLSALLEEKHFLLYTMDEYPSDSTYFEVLEFKIAVKDDRLAQALSSLPRKKRDVILLSFFLNMTDAEIANRLHVAGSTIHRRRTSSLEELKKRLEVLEDGQGKE